MMVKICGITNREDAEAAVEAGAAALGFNFYPRSPRCLTPQAAERIISALPPRVWKVGVFVSETPEAVAAVADQVGLDVAQIHGDTPSEPMPRGLRVWKAFRVDASFDSAWLDLYPAEAFLLDAPAPDAWGGTGRVFDWSRAVIPYKKIVLAGGLDAGNVREAIRMARPWGVDACSRLEAAPGRKDHRKMAEFLKAALSENLE